MQIPKPKPLYNVHIRYVSRDCQDKGSRKILSNYVTQFTSYRFNRKKNKKIGDDAENNAAVAPLHVLPSLARTKPLPQLQRYEPSVLSHSCWQPPFATKHSFTSVVIPPHITTKLCLKKVTPKTSYNRNVKFEQIWIKIYTLKPHYIAKVITKFRWKKLLLSRVINGWISITKYNR